jgi:hypothetical protein
MGEIMTLPGEQAFGLAVKLKQEHGWNTPQSGARVSCIPAVNL